MNRMCACSLEDSVKLVEFFNSKHAKATGAKNLSGLLALQVWK